jgi:hypothetical protein
MRVRPVNTSRRDGERYAQCALFPEPDRLQPARLSIDHHIPFPFFLFGVVLEKPAAAEFTARLFVGDKRQGDRGARTIEMLPMSV